MNLHEYQSKSLLRDWGLKVPKGIFLDSFIKNSFPMPCIGKIQIHAGGRGKAGGVQELKNDEDLELFLKKFLYQHVQTYQTNTEGQYVTGIYLEEKISITKEYYCALSLDREKEELVLILSSSGGMNIEEVSKSHPESIEKFSIYGDLKNFQIKRIAELFSTKEEIVQIFFTKILHFFYFYDLSMLEINPLGFFEEQYIILDAKIIVDDNALFRQKKMQSLQDLQQLTVQEQQALSNNLSYVSLVGNIGCLVNGAGLAMATMDLIKNTGGEPSNFLDVGGNAQEENIKAALKILFEDSQVKVLFINIFGGIMRCDLIAKALISMTHEFKPKIPLVVRLQGSQSEEGRDLLKKSGLSIHSFSDLQEAAQKAVSLAKDTL
jgi:succinyl-CoA synthetase beta subunit